MVTSIRKAHKKYLQELRIHIKFVNEKFIELGISSDVPSPYSCVNHRNISESKKSIEMIESVLGLTNRKIKRAKKKIKKDLGCDYNI